jgi:homopolymeric O-antigen transport system permease protein
VSKDSSVEMQNDIAAGAPASVAVAPRLDNLRVNRIERSSGWVAINLRELWESRELIYFLIWRDVKVRYKQSLLGAAWAILQPFLTMVIFTIFFGRLAKVPSDGVPYPLFSYSALVAWTFFATGLGRGADGLVGSADMIKKVYFPRMAVPIARVAAPLVDFFLSFLVLILMMRRYHVASSVRLLWLPACLLLVVITALGASLWLSALNVEFRDVQFVVPFLIQIWFFATPVIYPASMVPQRWRVLYAMNPMASAIETFRWALLGSPRGSGFALAMSAFVALGVLVSGAVFFRRMEKSFADIL